MYKHAHARARARRPRACTHYLVVSNSSSILKVILEDFSEGERVWMLDVYGRDIHVAQYGAGVAAGCNSEDRRSCRGVSNY